MAYAIIRAFQGPKVGIKDREIRINWLRKAKRKQDLSVVVVVYNMGREAPRALHSLSAAYQRHIDPADYEVIDFDKWSSPFPDPIMIRNTVVAGFVGVHPGN